MTDHAERDREVERRLTHLRQNPGLLKAASTMADTIESQKAKLSALRADRDQLAAQVEKAELLLYRAAGALHVMRGPMPGDGYTTWKQDRDAVLDWYNESARPAPKDGLSAQEREDHADFCRRRDDDDGPCPHEDKL